MAVMPATRIVPPTACRCRTPRFDTAVEEPIGRVSSLHRSTHRQATNRQLTNSAHRIMDIIVLKTSQPAKRSFFLARSPRTMKTGKATSTYRGIPGKHEAETRDMRGRLFLLQHRLSIPSEGRDRGQSPNCEISGPSAGYAAISLLYGRLLNGGQVWSRELGLVGAWRQVGHNKATCG